MSADIATLLDVEDDWDDDPPGRLSFPFLFVYQTRYLPALAFWAGNIPIYIPTRLHVRHRGAIEHRGGGRRPGAHSRDLRLGGERLRARGVRRLRIRVAVRQ